MFYIYSRMLLIFFVVRHELEKMKSAENLNSYKNTRKEWDDPDGKCSAC